MICLNFCNSLREGLGISTVPVFSSLLLSHETSGMSRAIKIIKNVLLGEVSGSIPMM